VRTGIATETGQLHLEVILERNRYDVLIGEIQIPEEEIEARLGPDRKICVIPAGEIGATDKRVGHPPSVTDVK